MSFGNSYSGGRTRMKSKVVLNVYDLSPYNDYFLPVGLGFYHCGVEVNGREYTFGGGPVGSPGVFDHAPRQPGPPAIFRCSIDMGTYDGGSDELNRALDKLRYNDGPFSDGGNYNIIRRNCNHFCEALCWQLLRRPIPSWINRMAKIGDCCSWFIPKQLLEDQSSPTGGAGKASSGNKMSSSFDAFAGKGQSLGGGGSSTSNSNNDKTGLLSRLSRSTAATSTSTSSSSSSGPDDLTDRREKARKAALARMERNQQQAS